MPHAPTRPPCVGVFDSGVGGLSVLRALHASAPQRDVLYLADTRCAPYGDRSGDFVRERALAMAGELVERGAGLLVVACNTATAWAVDAMRECWPQLPIVGVEPGLKPAAGATRNRRVGVLATPATLRSARFRQLLADHLSHCEVQLPDCDGLATAIERLDEADPALDAMLERIVAPLRAAGVDTVVLGCTHYPLVAHRLRAKVPADVVWIDTAQAIARRVTSLQPPVDDQTGDGRINLLCTGAGEDLQRMAAHWLGLDLAVANLPA